MELYRELLSSHRYNADIEIAQPDPLANIGPVFNWGYVPAGTNLKDPQLSPVYAPSSKLPPKIYIIGCEFDLLCRESEILAERLASERSGEVVTSGPNWEKGGITFEKIIGEKHGA
jgi:acetyl esterase/lipase